MNGSTYFKEWQSWWRGLSSTKKGTPLFVVIFYLGFLFAVNGVRGDLVASSVAPLALYYLGPRFHPWLGFLLPLCLTSLIYDSQRYYSDFLRGPIHVTEPYYFDKNFFGVSTSEGILTPNEWFQKHTHPLLDFFTGLSYIIFIPVYVLTAAYFRFWYSRKGNPSCTPYRANQMMWAFLWVNLLGYSTYYWYAAAPPWYVTNYGLGPAQLGVQANLGGCIRFDNLIGIPIFSGWYGKSADVFGAIPSLHVAYPFMGAYYAFRFGTARMFTTLFYCLVAFAAVYLNHHYLLDVIWGSTYALLVASLCDYYYGKVPAHRGWGLKVNASPLRAQ